MFTCDTAFPVAGGLGVSAYNFAINTINSLVFVYRVSRGKTSPLRSNWAQYTGLALLIAGVGMEIAAEESRKAFKRKPENKGRIDDTGLFGVVRHPNYLGYTLSRVGMALATGSWLNAVLNFGFQVAFFTQGSIPELSGYMSRRYGTQWNVSQKRSWPSVFSAETREADRHSCVDLQAEGPVLAHPGFDLKAGRQQTRCEKYSSVYADV